MKYKTNLTVFLIAPCAEVNSDTRAALFPSLGRKVAV